MVWNFEISVDCRGDVCHYPARAPGVPLCFPPVQLGHRCRSRGPKMHPGMWNLCSVVVACGECSEEKVLGLVGSDPTQQGWKWFSWMETLVKFRQELIAGWGTTSWFLTHSSMVHHWLDLNLNDDSMTLDLLYQYSFLWFHSRTHTFQLNFLAKNACIFSSTNHLIISLSYTELKKVVRWIFGPWVTSGDFWGGGPLLPRTPYWSTNTLQQIQESYRKMLTCCGYIKGWFHSCGYCNLWYLWRFVPKPGVYNVADTKKYLPSKRKQILAIRNHHRSRRIFKLLSDPSSSCAAQSLGRMIFVARPFGKGRVIQQTLNLPFKIFRVKSTFHPYYQGVFLEWFDSFIGQSW